MVIYKCVASFINALIFAIIMRFQCTNAGECCTNPSTQIAVTLGDIMRIKQFTKLPIEKIIPHYVAVNPFGDPEKPQTFDLELGLNIPCRFREGNRCTIYKARPLNCRLFPYWILAHAPQEKIKEIGEPGCKCLSHFEMDEADRPVYKSYADALGKIMEQESAKTDSFMQVRGLSASISLYQEIDFKKFLTKLKDKPLEEVHLALIDYCKRIIEKQKNRYSGLKE